MDCKRTKDNLFACIDHELDPSEELILKEHLLACTACRHAYEKIQSAWQVLDSWEDFTPPHDLQKHTLRKIKGRREAQWLSVILPAAAVLLIISGMLFFFKAYDSETNRQLAAENERTSVQSVSDITQENVDDIVSNLQLLREKDFFDSLDKLEKMDYLPLIDDHQQGDERRESSSLELIRT